MRADDAVALRGDDALLRLSSQSRAQFGSVDRRPARSYVDQVDSGLDRSSRGPMRLVLDGPGVELVPSP